MTVAVLLVMLAAVGFGYERVKAARDAQNFPPPGRIVAVDGPAATRRILADVDGEKAPPVVFCFRPSSALYDEFARDVLVRIAICDEPQHFELAWRQSNAPQPHLRQAGRGEPCAGRRASRERSECGAVAAAHEVIPRINHQVAAGPPGRRSASRALLRHDRIGAHDHPERPVLTCGVVTSRLQRQGKGRDALAAVLAVMVSVRMVGWPAGHSRGSGRGWRSWS